MIRLLSLGLIIVLFFPEAYACVCGEATVRQLFHEAAFVFTGVVKAKRRGYAFNQDGVLALLQVEQIWKGSVPEQIEVFTGPTGDLYRYFEDCATPFNLAERYLVFAKAGDLLATNVCQGTSSFPAAEKMIKQLPPEKSRDGARPFAPSVPDERPDISGRVIDNRGATIPGATVTLRGHAISQVTQTDELGSYRFERVPGGLHQLVFEMPGFFSVTHELDIKYPEKAHIDVLLNVDTTIPANGSFTTLALEVEDGSTKAALSGAEVRINGTPMIADRFGRASIVFRPGPLSIIVRKTGYTTEEREVKETKAGYVKVGIILHPIE